jgi:protein PhnA
MEQALIDRSGAICELCTGSDSLAAYEIPPSDQASIDKAVYLCSTCTSQINDPSTMDENHWRCLNDTMWSEHIPVQVMAYRTLHHIAKGWASELADQMYLEEDTMSWARLGLPSGDSVIQKDSNGTVLLTGDSVTLIKDLVVKGANFTAKRGTLVKNINLTEDPKHIEGRVNGTTIVLVTAFLKKVI